jgi:hypothetical protein
LAYLASLGRLVPADDHAFGYTVLVSFSSADCCERRTRVYQRYLAFASLQLMTSLAVDRTIANVDPPAAVPQITGADT